MALRGKGVPGRGAAGAKALRWDGAWHARNRAGRPAEQRGRRGQRSERRQGQACVLAATGRSACLLVLSGVPWRPSSKDTWSDVGFRTGTQATIHYRSLPRAAQSRLRVCVRPRAPLREGLLSLAAQVRKPPSPKARLTWRQSLTWIFYSLLICGTPDTFSAEWPVTRALLFSLSGHQPRPGQRPQLPECPRHSQVGTCHPVDLQVKFALC